MLWNERSGRPLATHLEGAFDSQSRRRGLLGRDGLAEGAALIIAPCQAIHTFRMRFPIDVVFADRQGLVVGVRSNVGARRLGRRVARVRDHRARPPAPREHADIRVGDRLVVIAQTPRPQATI